MAVVISGRDILEHGQRIAGADKSACLAVAYWSGGAMEALGLSESTRVVLDVESGGTCPIELRSLMDRLGTNLRVLKSLHAKIIATPELALVGSANASKPGLHLNGQGNSEAAVILKGSDAREAYDLAVRYFDAGEPAREEDVETCAQRFGKWPRGRSETGNDEPMEFLDALMASPSPIGHLPIIMTDNYANPEETQKAWTEQRADLSLEGLPRDFDDEEWDDFSWVLDSRYRDELCLSFAIGKKGGLQMGLVRPSAHIGENWTFARRIPWKRSGVLSYPGKAWIPVRERSDGRRDQVVKAMRKLVSDDKDFLRVHDLIQEMANEKTVTR